MLPGVCKGGAQMSAGNWLTRELKASASRALQKHCKCQPLPKHARYQEPFKFNQRHGNGSISPHRTSVSPTIANRKMQMKLLTIASAALIAVAGSTQAMSDSGRTRAEVKAELAEAIRTGDIIGSGESGLRLNQLHPHRYPTVAKPSGKTRHEVKAELAEAIRTGDIIASGESSYKRNELRPDLYPAVAKEPGSTREQVKAELAEAIRSGNIITVGEASLTQNQLFPDRYRSDTRTARGGDAISTQ